MKKSENIFKSIKFFNCNELRSENKQPKKQIDMLEQMINTFQTKMQSNNSTITTELNEIRHSMEQQSKELESITKKIDKLVSDVDTPKQKDNLNMIATIIAIVFTFAIMIINIVDMSKSNTWDPNLIIILKMAEALISAELIFHTGLLSKYDKNRFYFWGSRIIYTTAIVAATLIIHYSNNPSFDINYGWLSYVNIVLSSMAFIMTFLGNLRDYTYKENT